MPEDEKPVVRTVKIVRLDSLFRRLAFETLKSKKSTFLFRVALSSAGSSPLCKTFLSISPKIAHIFAREQTLGPVQHGLFVLVSGYLSSFPVCFSDTPDHNGIGIGKILSSFLFLKYFSIDF